MERDRRKLLLALTGAVVGIAVIAVLLTSVLGDGGDGGKGTTAAEDLQPLRLTAPPDTSGIIGVDGQPAQLSDEEMDAVLDVVLGYLRAATVTAVTTERPDEDETTTTEPGTRSVASYFTRVAATRLESDDVIVLTDEHLPFAGDGVSTTKLTVALAGIVQDGTAQFVNASIDVVMVVKGDEDITVQRRGDLVLRSNEGTWGIAGYQLSVQRDFGDRTTTTSEAAFG